MAVSPRSFTAVIDLWPTIAAFAVAIGEPYENARQWRLNDSIPGRAFAAIVRAAGELPDRRGAKVTHELLCGFAEAKHADRKAGVA